jgi:hypothetical protein
MHHSRIGRQAVSTVASIVDPGRAPREASADFERTPSADHRAPGRCAARVRPSQGSAGALSRQLVGPSRQEREVAPRSGQTPRCRPVSRRSLRKRCATSSPMSPSVMPVLLFAQAHAEAGDEAAALAAFDEAMMRHNSTETRCAHGLYLASRGSDARARELLDGVLRDSKLVDEHAHVLNRASLDQARAALNLSRRPAAPTPARGRSAVRACAGPGRSRTRVPAASARR